jgi:hypothetical protein
MNAMAAGASGSASGASQTCDDPRPRSRMLDDGEQVLEEIVDLVARGVASTAGAV